MYDYKKTVRINLKKFRKEKRLTQREVAVALGVKDNTIARWENGVHSPSIEYLTKMAKFFDKDILTPLG